MPFFKIKTNLPFLKTNFLLKDYVLDLIKTQNQCVKFSVYFRKKHATFLIDEFQ